MQKHFSARNTTRAATAWVASPVGRLARVEVLVVLSCTLLTVLVFLGSGRRASRSGSFRFVVWSALMLSYPAVSYTIGLMQSASFRNELVVAWGCFLLLLLGCTDGIAAYTFNDLDQQARTMLNQGLQLVYVLLLLLSYANSLPPRLGALLFLLWALSAVKLAMRVRSFLLAGRARVLTVDNKLIADYMLREHELGGADYDAASMRGYKYVVAGEAEGAGGDEDRRIVLTNDLITVDRVWRCEGRMLSSGDEATGKLRDLCLSFALFKLLLRRLGGYPLHESRLNKTRDFVKTGLLNTPGDHERMYRVVEVELGFLFDFFYARYPSPKETLIPDTLVFAAVLATSLATLFSSALLNYHAPEAEGAIIVAATTRFDIWLTRMIIVLFIVLESFQYLSLVFSDWHKVKMLCRYVREPSWQNHPMTDVLIRLMCRARLALYWNNSVGQYSLLYACFRTENSCALRVPLPGWIRRVFIRSRATEQRQLPTALKRAIHRFLKSGLTRIRNGECALEENRMLDRFSWAIGQESAVHRILVWHMATTMCDLQFGKVPAEGGVIDDHLVATTLSDYCAYLVSSAPELLPGHSYDTLLLFEAVQRGARRCLRRCRSKDGMYSELKKLKPDSPASAAILAEGAKLGAQLMETVTDATVRWKVLAEMWVEMLLSVAPSENVTGHIQRLATGGELVTHLWALLTHAGIVERPSNRYQRSWIRT